MTGYGVRWPLRELMVKLSHSYSVLSGKCPLSLREGCRGRVSKNTSFLSIHHLHLFFMPNPSHVRLVWVRHISPPRKLVLEMPSKFIDRMAPNVGGRVSKNTSFSSIRHLHLFFMPNPSHVRLVWVRHKGFPNVQLPWGVVAYL